MSLDPEAGGKLARRFPRVSGDEPQIKTIIGAAKTFSPRERG